MFRDIEIQLPDHRRVVPERFLDAGETDGRHGSPSRFKRLNFAAKKSGKLLRRGDLSA
jgi:hypothetical protein